MLRLRPSGNLLADYLAEDHRSGTNKQKIKYFTVMESFNHVNDWLTEVNKFAPEDTCKLLVGNKCDKVTN